MSKIEVESYELSASREGTTTLSFKDKGGEVVRVSLLTAAVMGLATNLRRLAKAATVPIARQFLSAQAKISDHPFPEPNTGEASQTPPALQYDVAVSADLDRAVLSFRVPYADGGQQFEITMGRADLEQLRDTVAKATKIMAAKPQSVSKH